MITDYNELLGQALGTCTLQRLLGRGGMGAVYLARQSRPRRTVAVKVLMPGIVLEKRSRTEFLARFRREADAIALLDHINIMPIYEYGEQGDIAYLVMPYVTGGTLRDVLEKRGALPLEEIVTIIEQAAAGLDSAHSQGIIHRDLKPGNMLFHADGRILLADFGLAKVLREVKDNNKNGQSGPSDLTSTGTIVGTPEYLSPEQGTGQAVDYRTDVYSLGIVLYQMLSGRVPFTGASPVAVAIKHALEEPPPLLQLNPSIPPKIEAVVMKAIAKEPEQRYASAGELAEALRLAAGASQKYAAYIPPKTPTGHIAAIQASDDNDVEAGIPTLAMKESTKEDTEETTPTQPAIQEEEQPTQPELEKKRAVEFHGAMTEEAPRVPKGRTKDRIPAAKPVDVPPPKAAEVPDQLQKPQVRVKAAKIDQPEQYVRRYEQRHGCQSASMMLLGSALTLLVVVGLFAAYLYYVAPGLNTTKNPAIKTPISATPTHQTTTKLSLPPARIAAGPLLFGTDLPGQPCDKHGGKWRNTGNVKVTCETGATRLINTGSNTAGIYLDSLPQNQPVPSNYILQIQLNANSSQGVFDVFFRNQAGSRQGGYDIQVDSGAGSWQIDAYDSGSPSMLFGKNLQNGSLRGMVTLDIKVQGDTYYLFTNGTQEGYAQSGSYTTGGIGLSVNPGANVSIKNFAIYALS